MNLWKKISLKLWAFLLAGTIYGQENSPLITVSHHYIAVLVFEGQIDQVHMGSADYVAKINHNLLLIRSKRPHTPPTSLVVTYGEEHQFFNAILAFAKDPPKTYDLRPKPLPSPKQATATEPLPMEEDLRKGLEALKKLPQQYKNIGVKKGTMQAILTKLLHDRQYLYLQVCLVNKSSMDFKLEESCFTYQESARACINVEPLLLPKETLVKAHKANYLLFVLPLYATKGKLVMHCWEEKGARNLHFSIPGKMITRSRYVP